MTSFRSSNHADKAAGMGCVPRAHSLFFRLFRSPKIRTRLLTAIRQCKERIVTRDALLLRSGLSFFTEELEVDLVLMQLIREHAIDPVADAPFTFALHSSPKGEDSCERSPSKQAAASG